MVSVDLWEASSFPFLYTGLKCHPSSCGVPAEGTQELDLALKDSIFLEEHTVLLHAFFELHLDSCCSRGHRTGDTWTPGHEEGLRNLP